MSHSYLYDVMSQHNRWLSVRQSVVAQNVANVNTPGFKTMDVRPFSETLDETRLDMARTSSTHMALETGAFVQPEVDQTAGVDVLHSGSNVGLEREFAKSGEISRSFALNTSVLKAFNRMLLMSSKG